MRRLAPLFLFLTLTIAGLAGPAAASCDARGNATTAGALAFAYDFANQPTAVSGASAATHVYDGNLKRVKTVSDGKTVYSIYSRLTGTVIYRDEATDNKKWDYVVAGGASLKFLNGEISEYSHLDHLGSAVAATNASGAVIWRESYAPFGERRNRPAANANHPGFTGHIEDAATGLAYMQARYYDPIVGRFLSTDPIGYQDQLNLYAYVANDPVNKIDPNGEAAETIWDVANVVAGVASAGANLAAGNIVGAAIDAAGVVIDAAAAVTPVVPGGAAAVIKGAREGGEKLSQRAATREAKRQAGIPTSQQAKSQQSAVAKDGTKVGRQQTFETPKPGGGTQEKSVQVSRDQVGAHAGQPQIEAGNVKAGGQTDSAGRPRIENENKVRVDFDPDR